MYLHSREQAQYEKILAVQHKHFKQVLNIALIYDQNLPIIQNLLSPERYGWKCESTNELYKGAITQSLPTPISVNNIMKCNCYENFSKNIY